MKKSNWVLIVVLVLAALVAGIGFIPITEQVPYTAVEDQPLTYTAWGADVDESWWDCDIWIWVNVRNTDSEGGYFSVEFSCRKGASWHTQTQTHYVAPAESKEFKVEFLKDCGLEWGWRYPSVSPPTKQVIVQGYRTETRWLLWSW